MSEEEITRMIADKDGRGAIDFDEFCHMMTAKFGERDTKEELMKAPPRGPGKKRDIVRSPVSFLTRLTKLPVATCLLYFWQDSCRNKRLERTYNNAPSVLGVIEDMNILLLYTQETLYAIYIRELYSFFHTHTQRFSLFLSLVFIL